MDFLKKLGIGVAMALGVIGGLGFLLGGGHGLFGVIQNATTETNPFWYVNGLYAGPQQQWSVSPAGAVSNTGTWSLGSSGTSLTQLLSGTCSLIASSYTVAASTTVAMDCAITGATSADRVFGMFATSTAIGGGWELVGASASSTNGFDTFRVFNGTGASAVIPASVASTTQYLNIR